MRGALRHDKRAKMEALPERLTVREQLSPQSSYHGPRQWPFMWPARPFYARQRRVSSVREFSRTVMRNKPTLPCLPARCGGAAPAPPAGDAPCLRAEKAHKCPRAAHKGRMRGASATPLNRGGTIPPSLHPSIPPTWAPAKPVKSGLHVSDLDHAVTDPRSRRD